MSYCWCNGVSEIAMDEMGWEGRGVITLFMVTENKLWAKEQKNLFIWIND